MRKGTITEQEFFNLLVSARMNIFDFFSIKKLWFDDLEDWRKNGFPIWVEKWFKNYKEQMKTITIKASKYLEKQEYQKAFKTLAGNFIVDISDKDMENILLAWQIDKENYTEKQIKNINAKGIKSAYRMIKILKQYFIDTPPLFKDFDPLEIPFEK